MRLSLIAIAAWLAIGAGAAAAQPPSVNGGAWTIAGPGQATQCTARLNGPQIDTIVTVNNDGRMVLIAGRANWRAPPGTETVTLQVDALPPRQVSGDHVVNLFLVLVTDDGLLKDLQAAHRITWTLKAGKFHADVTGLGVAFEAVRACKASLPAEPS